jgi:EmrB/QacA subfamily drug resistance transporter
VRSRGSVRPVSPHSKRLTLVACILGSAIVFIDATVVNVALPAIRDDLDAGLATQQWVVEAYLLTLGSLLLLGGSLGDLFGRRRIFALGVAAFAATSLLCAVAPTAEMLVAARALQGVAGALLVPGTLAVIVATFDESERGQAIGTWTAWTGVSTIVGPLAGGALVDLASWRWIFAVGLVPMVVTLVLVRVALPPDLDETSNRHVDWIGAVLCTLGLAGPVFALIEQPRYGWEDPVVALPLALGPVLLVMFVLHERRSPDPMLPLRLFRERNFGVGNLATLGIYAGLGSATFLLPVFLQQVAGWDAIEAGLSLLPVTVIMFLLSSRFGSLADRLGPHLFMGAGPIVAGAGLFLLVRLDADAGYAGEVLPAIAVFGVGLALTVAPLTATVLAGVDEHYAGIASGVNNAVARVAGLVAIAGVGAAVAAQFGSTLDERLARVRMDSNARAAVAEAKTRPMALDAVERVRGPERPVLVSAVEEASVDAFRGGVVISALIVVLGGIVSIVGIRNPRRPVNAEGCPGGAIVGASEDAGRIPAMPPEAPQPAPARV